MKAILTAPARIRLCVVKVETSEPGLYGVGCATFTQRIRTVVTAVNEYLAPFLTGKDADNIEDLWQAMYQSSYWRNGPVLMNALSGVDAALWDIKGKRAGMPLYQLLGGKCRTGVPVYRHAAGKTPEAVAEIARRFMSEGARYIRAQVGVEGQATYGSGPAPASRTRRPSSSAKATLPANCSSRPPIAVRCRSSSSICANNSATTSNCSTTCTSGSRPSMPSVWRRNWSRIGLFFLEDPFAPEDVGYFKILRQQCATPIAMGELFNNPNEWLDLVSGRLIDFIRCHLSQVGGISAARKIAALCDFFRVRTAWHGPGDTSPVGHAAHVHLDLATWNFGIQEALVFNDALARSFPRRAGSPRRHVVVQRKAGPGHRHRREARGEISDSRRPAV